MSMACPAGHPVDAGARFCPTCGQPVIPLEPPPPTLRPGEMPGMLEAYPPRAAASLSRSRRSRSALLIGAALLLATLALGAYSVFGGKHHIRGTVALLDSGGHIAGTWNDCEGSAGYSDFQPGMSLAIRGRNDEIVGSGTVTNVDEDTLPTLVQMDHQSDHFIGLDSTNDADARNELRRMLSSEEAYSCLLYFDAEVEDSDYYSIEVGSRGKLNYSREDLAKQNWIVSLSLGDTH